MKPMKLDIQKFAPDTPGSLIFYVDTVGMNTSQIPSEFSFEVTNTSDETYTFTANSTYINTTLPVEVSCNATTTSYIKSVQILTEGYSLIPSAGPAAYSFDLYVYERDTLAGKILANSTLSLGEPDFSTVATTDEGLYTAQDNDGTSAYFRGAVTNNYVKFGDWYWRIIRINGDGNVRMIYDGTEAHANGTASTDKQIGNHEANNGTGYMYTAGEQHGNTISSNIKVKVDDWYAENLLQDYSTYIADSGFWGDRTVPTGTVWTDSPSETFYYKAYERLYQNHSPSLVCDEILDFYTVSDPKGNQALTYPIGLITADEAIFAGGYYRYNSSANPSFYLARPSCTSDFYMMATMTNGAFFAESEYDTVHGTYIVDYSGSVIPDRDHSYYLRCVRPVINLYGNLEVTGSGTATDPYEIVMPTFSPVDIIFHEIGDVACPTTATVTFEGHDGSTVTETVTIDTSTGTASLEAVVPTPLRRVSIGSDWVAAIRETETDGEVTITIDAFPADSLTGTIIAANDPIPYSDTSEGSAYQPDFSTAATTDEGMFTAPDNDGASVYFRGAVTNNYVSFAGYYWRIIRTNGDGSVRLIYDGSQAYANGTVTTDKNIGTQILYSGMDGGYMYQGGLQHGNTYSSPLKSSVDSWYSENLSKYSTYIADSGFWGDRTMATGFTWSLYPSASVYYKAYERLYQNHSPSLVCDEILDFYTVSDPKGNQALTYPIGLITPDECVFAGALSSAGSASNANSQFYLSGGASSSSNPVATMAKHSFYANRDIETYIETYGLSYYGGIDGYSYSYNEGCVRPVISLVADISFTGTGSSTDPYTIDVPLTSVVMMFREPDGSVATLSETAITFESHTGETHTETISVTGGGWASEIVDLPTPLRRVTIGDGSEWATTVSESDGYVEVTAYRTNTLAGTIIAKGDPVPWTDTEAGSAYLPDFSTTATTDEGMYTALDVSGWSPYFRGATTNNYVKFGDWYWRVIRVNGNGTVRMIYDGTEPHANGVSSTDRRIGTCQYNSTNIGSEYAGYTYEAGLQRPSGDGTDSTIKAYVDNWYNTNIAINTKMVDRIATAAFVNDRQSFSNSTGTTEAWSSTGINPLYYAGNIRSIRTYTVSLNPEYLDDEYYLPIGLITSDEVRLAGGSYGTNNTTFYLNSGNAFWTMTPDSYASSFGVSCHDIQSNGSFYQNDVDNSSGVRPVINLNYNITEFTGSGTMTDPYEVIVPGVLVVNNVEPTQVFCDGVEVSEVYYNGKLVFRKEE